ncbi:response regulator transcription factor [Amycolatopsis sp. H20-H5]|uniref:response regulator transcription factor n=1 Tax=Amycolatopsis sp. H20-H5 TaxID=3046309 RepID=UPI002DB6F5FE|nr:response regulator transcription factor [Amycolatopsis sp. H20-H5]MEC3975494.1 response regulator transcription factor [Amycolatopsis sp. H20-H5]
MRVLLCAPLDADAENWRQVLRSAPDIVSVTGVTDTLEFAPHEVAEVKTVAVVHRSAGRKAIEGLAASVRESRGGVIVFGEGVEAVAESLFALDAGAYGYIGADRPVEQFVTAIRAVAGGYVFMPAGQLNFLADRIADLPTVKRDLVNSRKLTRREFDVLGGMARGHSNAEIGRNLFISESTVRTHVLAILRKLGARNRTEAVLLAGGAGIRPNTK